MKTKTPLTIDADRHEVFVGKREVVLTRTEFDILLHLKAKNTTQDREEIKAAAGIGNVETRTVDQHIARLRRKIGIPVIRTVPLRGYKWAA